jgi:hypothetical protein
MTALPEGAIYRLAGESVATSPRAGGPWDPRAQHGSPPAALVAHLAETLPTAVPMQVARLTIDLMRPVPVGPLTFTRQVVRDGRKIQLCAVSLFADGIEVVRGEVLRIRRHAVEVPATAAGGPLDVPLPDDCPEHRLETSRNLFLSVMSMRAGIGSFISVGPAAIWFRADWPLVEGVAPTPLVRAVMAADFCNGVGPSLDFGAWTFINADLTVALAREPVGDWILVNATSQSGGDGAGLAVARLADIRGYFGEVIQCTVVERRAAPQPR